MDHIVHISDIHIRLTKRHEEYREVFSKVYEEIKKTPTNTLIVNTGDTVHSKVDLSPECVQLASEFFKNLADLRPTIVIAGNHDCLLTNASRLDSISPIVDNLGHPNLFHLTESKLYSAANILFNNMSVFDDHLSFVKISEITKKIQFEFDTKIALFHGPVFAAKTDIGYSITNKTISNEIFNGHDIAMLGDIHLAQDLQQYNPKEKAPIIRYAGSLIQQNHGEALLGHGFSLWTIATREYKHIEIPNDYGHFTIDVDAGKLLTDISTLPKKPKLRVRQKDTIATELKRIVAEIRVTHEISDLVFTRVEEIASVRAASIQTKTNLAQISGVDYQNKLISDYLKLKYPDAMDEETLKDVCKINTELNVDLPADDQSKNVKWKPIKFEFSNLFSYGEDNIIDFTKLDGVYGIFAANASGKSSLMDALSFIIFDKSSRAFKANHVMNIKKNTFFGKFTFEINGVSHVIERKGTRDKKGSVKVDVNFYKLENDVKVPLNSEARRSTNEVIRDHLGSYEDFILTALSTQKGQGSFINMGQSDRKELLAQFIGLNVFDKLSEKASNNTKELSGIIKGFNHEIHEAKLTSLKADIVLLEAKLADLDSRAGILTFKKQRIDDEIELVRSTIVKLVGVPASVENIQREKLALESNTKSASESIVKINEQLVAKKEEYSLLASRVEAYSKLGLKDKYEKHESLTRNLQRTENEFEKIKSTVKEKMKKLEHLANHKYDPKCTFCCDNIFVKDAIATRESLGPDKAEGIVLMTALNSLNKEISELAPLAAQYQESAGVRDSANVLSAFISKKELEVSNLTNLIDKNISRVTEIDRQIQLFEKSKETIEANKLVESTVRDLLTQSSTLKMSLKTISDEHVDAHGRRVSAIDQTKNIESRLEESEKAETRYATYQYYLTAVGKDGVPYKIISDAVPTIEQEVNNILSQIVEFSVSIETDGKNVNVYIKYEDEKWPLELASGMESFIATLALRVALINISNLPRPNFLFVDEGFSALDAANMPMIQSVFDYLKSIFDFTIVISHVDAMRDMVDKHLEIKKENGLSKVDNTG